MPRSFRGCCAAGDTLGLQQSRCAPAFATSHAPPIPCHHGRRCCHCRCSPFGGDGPQLHNSSSGAATPRLLCSATLPMLHVTPHHWLPVQCRPRPGLGNAARPRHDGHGHDHPATAMAIGPASRDPCPRRRVLVRPHTRSRVCYSALGGRALCLPFPCARACSRAADADGAASPPIRPSAWPRGTCSASSFASCG